MSKKVMLLGGNYYQKTAVLAVKELGYKAIDVDYLPDNPAHKYADEYYNISTTDRDAVLKKAMELDIDGIVSYASDVSAPTAAYVAEKMGLPTNPSASVEIMTKKDLFRNFLKSNGFRVPAGKGFSDRNEAFYFFSELKKPVMIKPVDSSGSKGVSCISEDKEFDQAFELAMSYSIAKRIVIEEFMLRDGHQIAGDGFIVDGKLVYAGFMNEHFDDSVNPYVPIGESFPARMTYEQRNIALQELQRCISELNLRQGAINLDFMFDRNGAINILEIGPRNGGNLITDAIKVASGVDLAKFTILAAVGEDCSELRYVKPERYVSSYVIHSQRDGVYCNIDIKDELRDKILLHDMFVKNGDRICRFENGGYGIGAMLIRYESENEMVDYMDHMNDFIEVDLEEN